MTFFSSLAWTGISFLLFTVLVAVISAWKTRDEQLDALWAALQAKWRFDVDIDAVLNSLDTLR